MSVLILEGIDGTGKTTLARTLTELYPFQYEAVGPPDDKDKALVEYLNRLLKYKDGEMDVVFDRFHWGSQAYGLEFRGRRDLSGREMEYLDCVLAEHGCAVVYCEPSHDAISRTITARKAQGELDPRGYEDSLIRLEMVKKEFQFCRELSPHPVFTYDYERDNIVDLFAWITRETGVMPL